MVEYNSQFNRKSTETILLVFILILCHLNDLKNENMLDLLYHLYERIVKYKLTHFSGGYNRTNFTSKRK